MQWARQWKLKWAYRKMRVAEMEDKSIHWKKESEKNKKRNESTKTKYS